MDSEDIRKTIYSGGITTKEFNFLQKQLAVQKDKEKSRDLYYSILIDTINHLVKEKHEVWVTIKRISRNKLFLFLLANRLNRAKKEYEYLSNLEMYLIDYKRKYENKHI